MKGIIMTAVALLVGFGLYFGFINIVGKTMQSKEGLFSGKELQTSQTKDLQEKQRKKAEEVRKKQKKLMEERRTRLLEHQMRN